VSILRAQARQPQVAREFAPLEEKQQITGRVHAMRSLNGANVPSREVAA
jgi:hypothetical protein